MERCWDDKATRSIVVGVVAVAVVIFWYYWFGKDRTEGRTRIPQGSSGWPLIGETLDFIACGYSSRPVSFMDKRKSLYGEVFRTHILGTPIVVSTNPEVNKVVLQNHGCTFVPAYPKSIRELLGKNSILQMNGNLQKRLHSLIGGFLRSPHFKARITRDIERTVKSSLASWGCSDVVLFQKEIKKMTFEVLIKVLMSVDPGEDLDFLKREFEEFIKGLICLPIKLPGTRLYKSLKAKERLLKLVERIVKERKVRMEQERLDKKWTVNDAVDLLLQENFEMNNEKQGQGQGQGLPLDFICGNIIEMMIPGEETVPTAMTLAIKFLSDSPLALKHLMEENMELKMGKASSGEDISWTDYMSLTFTQNVISETLRLANIINAVWRKAVKDVEIKGCGSISIFSGLKSFSLFYSFPCNGQRVYAGYLIPQGWCVLASFISVHMDDKVYNNPYEFNPWRWEKMGGAANNSSFTPFGGGQRLCPGLELSRLEISIFLHHFVTTFSWVAEEDVVVSFPTVKMKRSLPIRVTPLSSNLA